MRLNYVGMFALAAALCPAQGQPPPQRDDARVADLAARLVPVRSIAPDDEDFADLLPLVDSIGSARIVALGEATHGDGAAFHAKARLVRFLHQVMGFDVLAWEAGIFACHQLDVAMRTGEGLREATGDCGRGIWGRSAEAAPVFEYVRRTQQTARPMASAGFDTQFALEPRQRTAYPAHIIQFFDRLDRTLLTESERADLHRMSSGLIYADYYNRPGVRDFNTALLARLRRVMDDRDAQLRARFTPREMSLTRQMLDSMIGLERWLARVGVPDDARPGVPHRGVLMADNVLWLARDYYPNRKIILWSHNYHAMRDVYTAPTAAALDELSSNATAGSIGRHVARSLGEDYFAVGFLGHAGEYGTSTGEAPTPIPPAPPGTLEDWLHRTGARYAWLDLRGLPPDHWLGMPTAARFYFWQPATTVWPRIYDAVFYIDRMYRSTPLR